MSDPRPQTVGDLVTRLRKMLGHVGKKDRQVVHEAIAAILELNERLYLATHTPRREDTEHDGETTVQADSAEA